MKQQVFLRPLIAYDNSQLSIEMLNIVDHLIAKFQKVTILNVHDPEQTYILKQFKGQHIYDMLKKQRYLGSQWQNKVSIQSKEVADKSINQIILENFVAKSSTILFLGYVGTKGFKPCAKDLSSRVRQFVYESKLNLAIIKHAITRTNKVLFCFDGSDISLDGLSSIIALAKTFSYELTVLHVYNQDLQKHSKHVKIQLKNVQEVTKEVKFKTVVECVELLSYLKDHQGQYDWIACNKNGYRGSITKQIFIGSNSTAVLESVNCNLILLN